MRVNLKDLSVGTQFIFSYDRFVTGEIGETFANQQKYAAITVGGVTQEPITLIEDMWTDIDLLINVDYSEIGLEEYYQLTFDDLESSD